jgi:hypothetical protein
MTLARTTLKYGDVYLCAICFNAFFSPGSKTILYGLFLGISHLLFGGTISLFIYNVNIYTS